jgi:hypothetical protein
VVLRKLDSFCGRWLLSCTIDGRVRDITTGNIDYNNESSVYSILNPNNEELIVKSLKEAADIVNVHYSTLSKKLDIESKDFHPIGLYRFICHKNIKL